MATYGVKSAVKTPVINPSIPSLAEKSDLIKSDDLANQVILKGKRELPDSSLFDEREN